MSSTSFLCAHPSCCLNISVVNTTDLSIGMISLMGKITMMTTLGILFSTGFMDCWCSEFPERVEVLNLKILTWDGIILQ